MRRDYRAKGTFAHALTLSISLSLTLSSEEVSNLHTVYFMYSMSQLINAAAPEIS